MICSNQRSVTKIGTQATSDGTEHRPANSSAVVPGRIEDNDAGSPPDTRIACVVAQDPDNTTEQTTLPTSNPDNNEPGQAESASPTWGSLWAAAYEALESSVDHRHLLDKFKRHLVDSERTEPLGTRSLLTHSNHPKDV